MCIRDRPWSAWVYDTVTTNTYSLTGLPNSTYYHWQVATMCESNGNNNSGFGSYVIFTTASCNVSLSTSQTNVVCNGGSDGSIDLSVSGGSGSYTYSWSNGATTQDLTSLSAGTYTVTVTDTWGCTASTSIVITESAPITYSNTQTICDGSSITVGSSTYTTSGTYTDILTSSAGCDSTVTTTLIVNNHTTSTSSHTECDSYTWNGTTYTSSGTYTWAGTNAAGCDSTATLNLTINNAVTTTNNQTVCYGSTYTINGNTYSSSGSYTDVLTASNGCDSTVVTNLTVLPQFSVSVQSVGSSTACSGSTVTLNMSTYASPANTYQWNDANGPISGANTSSYDASVSGTYSLTVTTPDGCTATSSGFAVSIVSMTPPTGLSTSNIQLTKATMNWSSVANAHHYDIRMRAQGSSTWTIAINNISALATSQQKSNLTSSTTYEWQIRSACSAGSSSVSAWSSTQTFTTLTPCTAPLNATTANITLNSADLTWDAVSGAWGYRVRYKQTSQPWSAWVYDTVTTNTYSLTGLPNNTYYH